MKYAYNAEKLVEILLKFKDALKKIPHNGATCLLQKISVYFEKTLHFGNGKASFSAALCL